MGFPVLILGESGSGKSASLRNFDPHEVRIFNVASKQLPFKKKLAKLDHAGYTDIYENLQKQTVLTYVVDDSQYLMTFEMFSKVNDVGYNKFTQCAMNFYNLLKYIIDGTPDDCIVYFLHHVDRGDDGHIKAKTQGKMLDNQLTLEGLFTVVLMCVTDGKEHSFITQSDGTNPCKSPMEMLPDKMENDLKAVDTAIREYYGMKKFEDKKESDKK